MGFTIKNLDKLLKQVSKAPESMIKFMEVTCKECAEIVLKAEQKSAPKDTGNSAMNLDIVDQRKGTTYAYYEIGINARNWDMTKGLWFQNYGFHNWLIDERIVINVGWMKKAVASIQREVNRKYDEMVSKSFRDTWR